MNPAFVPPVLVVEDSDEDYETVKEAARRAGLHNELVRAITGDACLCLLRGVSRLRPAFVLLDLNIPGLNGRDVIAEIKVDRELRRLPVLVLSTSANPKDLIYCYKAGANVYHVKPVRYLDHLSLVADIFTYWLSRATLAEIGEVPS